MQALHCERKAWLSIHKKEIGTPQSKGVEMRLAQGLEIGKLAQRLFPGGQTPSGQTNEDRATSTMSLLEQKTPVYEAVFVADGTVVYVDIATPNDAGWTMVEVKSSTRVKPEHIEDIAFQSWVAQEAGFNFNKTVVAHVDASYKLRSDIDDSWAFFKLIDVTEDVTARIPDLGARVSSLKTLVSGSEPSVEPSIFCRRPDRCPFYDHCHVGTAIDDIQFFPGLSQDEIVRLREENRRLIGDLEPQSFFTAVQKRALQSANSQGITVEASLSSSLESIDYPLAFVDFEAFNSGIPLLPGSRPYQPIPFQWSVHLAQGPGHHVSHEGYLHQGMNDPRDSFVETLELATRSAKSIVHYSPYELILLKGMAEDGVPGANTLLARFKEKSIDLLKIIRENIYDTGFQGSFSLKVVLTALVPGLDYRGLAVQDGDSAAAAYLEFFSGSLDKQGAEQTLSNLEKYCMYDTWALARVFERLVELAGSQSE